jgi:hypothetical protein
MSQEPAAPRRRKKTTINSAPVRRRDLLVLLGVWLVGCSIVATIVGLFYLARRPAEVDTFPQVEEAAEVAFSDQSAKVAYAGALGRARAWQPDVQLVSVTAAWDNTTPARLGQAEAWDFSFFSPGHERIYLVTQRPEQAPAGRAHPFKLSYPSPVIAPESWLVDSNEAINIWLSSGGSTFLDTFPENHVELLLRQSTDANTPVWNIIGTSDDQSQLFFLTIDAATGTVLNRT